MKASTVLVTDELINILDGIWEYNQRGKISQVIFTDLQGQPIALGSVHVVYDDAELRVRSKPEEQLTNEQIVQRFSNIQYTDPKTVPPPLTIEQLNALGNA